MLPTPRQRLHASEPCGVVRDGHQMTLVRLDDVSAVTSEAGYYQAEMEALEKKCERLRDEKDRILAKYRALFNSVQAIKTTAAEAQQAAIDAE